MYKPFLLSLALSSLGAGALGADQTPSDVSVWRWSVSAILDSQRASAGVGALPADVFGQRYQRYSVVGLPEAAVEHPTR